MADTTPVTIRNVLYAGNNLMNLIAGGTILAGAIVAFASTGESLTVIAADTDGSSKMPIGVALNDALDGEYVTVAGPGCICYVYEGKGSAIDAGAPVGDCSVGGAVTTMTTAATCNVVGFAIEDITANLTGRIFVHPQIISKAAT
jgi:hypothetical protein